MLRDIVIPRREIPAADTTFRVRGLTPEDLTLLIADYPDAMERVLQILDSKAGASIGVAVAALFQQFPVLMAHAIALCAEEPDATQHVLKLPTGVQLKALIAIYELTELEAADIKKLAGLLMEPASATLEAPAS